MQIIVYLYNKKPKGVLLVIAFHYAAPAPDDFKGLLRAVNRPESTDDTGNEQSCLISAYVQERLVGIGQLNTGTTIQIIIDPEYQESMIEDSLSKLLRARLGL